MCDCVHTNFALHHIRGSRRISDSVNWLLKINAKDKCRPWFLFVPTIFLLLPTETQINLHALNECNKDKILLRSRFKIFVPRYLHFCRKTDDLLIWVRTRKEGTAETIIRIKPECAPSHKDAHKDRKPSQDIEFQKKNPDERSRIFQNCVCLLMEMIWILEGYLFGIVLAAIVSFMSNCEKSSLN